MLGCCLLNYIGMAVENSRQGNWLPGRVKQALNKAVADKEYIDQYLPEAISGDYDHLLAVTIEYVNFE